MSVTINAKGTSVSSFTIGKNGLNITGEGVITLKDSTNLVVSYGANTGAITAPAGKNLYISSTAGGGDYLYINGSKWPTGFGTNGQALVTDGSGNLSWASFSSYNAGDGLVLTGTTFNVVSASSSRIVVNADNIDLATTGVSASTYKSVTVDVYGRVTAGTNPTTLAGYGITDAQPLDSDLTAISNLTTTGLIVRTSDTTAATRSIAVSGTGLSVSNADGVSGNPTITSNATSDNTASTIVARDSSGNFSAGTITASLTGAASLNVLKAGDTMTGALTINFSNAGLVLTNSAGTDRRIAFQTALSNRWQVGTDNQAESGSNAGTNFVIQRYNDSGNIIDTPISISRSTGAVQISNLISATSVNLSTVAQQSVASLTTSTTNSNQVVDTFSASVYRSAKYQIQVTSASAYQMTEVLLIHNDTTAFITEYGTILTGSSLASFDADISSGSVRLLVTPVNAVTTIKAVRTAITV